MANPVHLCAIALSFAALLWPVAKSDAQCRLCGKDSGQLEAAPDAAPLRITISANLEFNTVASGRGGGEIALDPVSGQRQLSGNLVDLGGFALRGSARVTGEPGRSLRITLPNRILLSSPEGGTAEVIGLETNLSAQPRLDQTGSLMFNFGGKLHVNGNSSGKFRGRIPITADYD